MAAKQIQYALVLLITVSQPLMASATVEDFEPCKQKALAALEACFNDNYAYSKSIEACWPKNLAQFKQCTSEVNKRFVVDPAKQKQLDKMREAEKRIKAELAAEALPKDGNN